MKRKLCFAAAAFIFMLGIFLSVTRKDPIEKYIGYVYLSDGENDTVLKGYKIKALINKKVVKYKLIDIKEISDDLYEINVTEDSKSDVKLSFRKDFTGKIKYNIYNESFELISEAQEKLYFSGDKKGKFYVSVDVNWGNKKENILVRYYFSVNII